ncbi:family 43 glycosylhydrolase [Silvibacterium acidisoli]|uniref:family 43 glycosylhydrolase n=1 Tax=Acidobacteriaceae bacterium ZG23-2 TaxID=2883246 RepID=UPI00406C5C55
MSSSGTGGTTPTAPAIPAGIHPLTQVDATANTGYFEDPLPIHLAQTAGSYIPSIAGTTHQVLTCTTLASGCYSSSAITITTGAALMAQLPANTKLNGYQNNNIYQDNAGNWQMATTVTVNNPAANPNGLPWNVILHASPVSGSATSSAGVPLAWSSDALLIGSFTNQENANYDGKYLEDSGKLYLIYSRRLQDSPSAQDGIVAQLMTSAQQVDSSSPTTLLAPENNSDGGYKSELFDCASASNQFKLIETGNITVVNGKYAMAYSTGSFETPCYKVGIAWSDTLTGQYKKILQADTSNVWQNPSPEPEVLYLIQAQQSAWPNYVNSSVQGPGVPSLVQYPAGTWYLYFAGYDPSVPLDSGMFNPKLRQPYFMRLNVAIPANATVAGTSNSDLAGWISAATQ